MNAKQFTSPGIRRLVAATTLAAITLTSMGASPAAAVSVSRNGSPGTATIPFTYGSYVSYGSSVITAPYRTVSESPAYARSRQRVCVTPRLWTVGVGVAAPRWIFLRQVTHCAWIAASASRVVVDGADFAIGGDYVTMPLGKYSVDVVVTWQLANGKLIGRRVYDYVSTADYQCLTASCWTGEHALGAYLMFDY